MTSTQQTDPLLGAELAGRYRIDSVLGRGGMGTVYRAVQLATGRAVAIKTLLPELDESHEIRRRFEREAHATAFLQHPNLVDVFELGTTDSGSLFLAMELVDGDSVADLVERGPVHPRRTLVIARQALLGLGHAHQHGLVHRDMKPENIMLARAGKPGQEYEQVKLLDFGIVKVLAEAAGIFGWDKLTSTGVTFGTPAYMPPEQALGRSVDGRADLYAMGVIIFEMLTGRTPFVSDDHIAMLRMHVSRPPPAVTDVAGDQPWCTGAMERLVGGALAKQPGDRFADARAMADALERAFVSLDHLP
jgi:serine/threonine-protein kinase